MAKTISFAILHFIVAFTVGYLLTGSALVGGGYWQLLSLLATPWFFIFMKKHGKILNEQTLKNTLKQ